jgi:hypothetical protein
MACCQKGRRAAAVAFDGGSATSSRLLLMSSRLTAADVLKAAADELKAAADELFTPAYYL